MPWRLSDSFARCDKTGCGSSATYDVSNRKYCKTHAKDVYFNEGINGQHDDRLIQRRATGFGHHIRRLLEVIQKEDYKARVRDLLAKVIGGRKVRNNGGVTGSE